MKVHVLSRSGKELFKGGIELEDYATVRDLQREIYARTKWCYPSRQRLTLPSLSTEEKPTVLNPKWSLSDYCHKDNSENLTVLFKDLGHQVAYRTLMFLAYLGPLLVYPMFYYFPAVYKYFGHGAFETGAGRRLHPAQTYAMYYWCFHFSKRIVETYYLHRFSRESTPIYIVIRNCCHYWPFGVVIGYYMNHPLYTPPSDLQVKLGLGFGLLCQLANFYCHLILRGLRSCDGSDDYKIPRGFLFDMVTCANYTTEIYQWLGFSVAIQTVEGYAFLAASAYVMTACALPRHRRLKTLFDGKEGRERYPNRWVILPPFL